jgi:7-keto-8-aminopelargonate synthetase-like enzyme
MFKIVASFSRENPDHNFFYYEFWNHEVIKSIQEEFKNTPGSVGLEILEETDQKMEIAMVFEDKDRFMDFAANNYLLLEERSKMIENWVNTTGHTYKYYMIE